MYKKSPPPTYVRMHAMTEISPLIFVQNFFLAIFEDI